MPEVVLKVVVLREALVTGTPRADSDKLPAHKVGTHRRLALSNVLAYQALSSSRRRDALERMTRQAEGLGLYG